MENRLKESIQRCIDARKVDLHKLSRDIWSRPELSGEETSAHDHMVRFFSREESWTVEGHYKLPTAFRACWGPVGVPEGNGGAPVLNVAFLCEYDALPGIGHACGHNLIAEVGAAAALGLKGALEQNEHPGPVKITVLGTPAEETVGGKIDLMEAGAFADIDLVLMAHPAQKDAALQPTLAILDISVKYHGKACHASAYPWNGVNALDAAVLAYNNISVLRQQLRPDWRVHGIIKHGGEKSNIIPAYSELHYCARTSQVQDLPELRAKVEACFRAAADATGCQVELSYPGHIYYDILPNPTLEALYQNNGKALGIQFPEQPGKFSGSTDFGNVSYIIPGIHPFFYIGTDALNHTEEYTEAAGSEKAQSFVLRTAKALAMTAVDVACSPDLLGQVREDFRLATLKKETFDTS